MAISLHVRMLLLQVGFQPDVYGSLTSYEVTWSRTGAVKNLAQSSNVGIKGRWMFRVDGSNIQLPNKIPPAGCMRTSYRVASNL